MTKIYFSDDDNADIIISKIKKSPDKEVVFVVFSSQNPVLSVVNLKLFKRLAESLGKTISISTNDASVKILAENAAIKLSEAASGGKETKEFNINFVKNIKENYRSVDSIKLKGNLGLRPLVRRPALDNEKYPAKDISEFNISGRSKGLFAAFLAAAILAAAGAGYIILPKAEIAVIPKTEPMSASFDVVLNKNISALDKTSKEVPVTVIVADIEKSGQFNATGKKEVTVKASGIATVYNEWSSSPQKLVKNTRLLTPNGKLYRTTKDIVVPGFAREDGKDIPGSIDAPILAAEAGAEYNIDATTFTLPGLAGTSKYQKIYAKSVEPISGGARGYSTVVSEADLKEAKDFLGARAKQDLLSQLDEKKPSDLIMRPEAVSFKSDDLITVAKADQAVGKFKASLKTSAIAFLFNPAYVKEIAKDIFASAGNGASGDNDDKESNPENRGKKKYILAESLEIDYGNELILGPDKIKLTASARTIAYHSIDTNGIKGKLLGKSTEEVEEYIKNNAPEISKIKISLWPFWVKKIPVLERNIDIKVLLAEGQK